MCNNKSVDFYLELEGNDRVLIGSIPYDSVDEISFSMNNNSSEIDDFLNLLKEVPFSPVPDNYFQMCKSVGAAGRSALLAIPKDKLKAHVSDGLRRIQGLLCDTENADYLVTYLSIKRFLQRLSRASVDSVKLTKMIEETEHGTVAASLKSFLPDRDGRCMLTKYSSIGTSTGRLTVKAGPQILTAPSAVRECLRSTHKDGKIIQIDIVSAEPKFALHLKGGTIPTDVYTHVSEEILGGEIERHHAKLVTLCALYGQSAKNLEKTLPKEVSARGVIRETRRYFDYDYLIARLQTENKSGNFRNAVGRPLSVDGNDHLLVSYYLQSSVAESSILMFSQFVEKFSDYCDPLFIIHDALIIDCRPEFAKSILQKKNIKLSLGDWKFDAEVKLVSDI